MVYLFICYFHPLTVVFSYLFFLGYEFWCFPPSVRVERIFTYVVLQVFVGSVYLPMLSSKCACGAYIYLCCPPSVRGERVFTYVVLQVCMGSVYLSMLSSKCVCVERIFTYVAFQVCVWSVYLLILSSKCACGAYIYLCCPPNVRGGAYIYLSCPPSVRVERIFTYVVLQVCVWSVYLPMLSSKCACGACGWCMWINWKPGSIAYYTWGLPP